MTEEQSERLERIIGVDLEATNENNETLSDRIDALNINLDDFDDWQLHEITWGLTDNCPVEAVSLYANPDLSGSQMDVIRIGISDETVSNEDVKLYASPEFHPIQMSVILDGARDPNIDHEQLQIVANHDFTDDQMHIILYGFHDGLDASVYADPDLSATGMYSIMSALDDNLDTEDIVKYEMEGEAKLDSILNGDISINEISVWNVQNENYFDSYSDTGLSDEGDTYLYISTDEGNFEIRAIWDDDDPRYSDYTLIFEIDSGNKNFDERVPFYNNPNPTYDREDDVLDKIYNAINEGTVDVEEHNIKVESIGTNSNGNEESKVEFIYHIDEKIDIHSDYFEAGIRPRAWEYHPITTFCEENKDSLAVLSAKDYESQNFDSIDDFKEAVESVSENDKDDVDSNESENAQSGISIGDLMDLGEELKANIASVVDETIDEFKEKIEGADENKEQNVDNTKDPDSESVDDEADKADIDDQDDIEDNEDDWDSGDAVD